MCVCSMRYLQRLQLSHNCFSAGIHLFWYVFRVVQSLIDLCCIVNHICLLQKVNLRPLDVCIVIKLPVGQELQQWECQMTIEAFAQLVRQIMIRHFVSDVCEVCRSYTVTFQLQAVQSCGRPPGGTPSKRCRSYRSPKRQLKRFPINSPPSCIIFTPVTPAKHKSGPAKVTRGPRSDSGAYTFPDVKDFDNLWPQNCNSTGCIQPAYCFIREMAGALGCGITPTHTHGMHPQQPRHRRAAVDKCGRHASCISCPRGARDNAPNATDTPRDTSVSALSDEHQEAMKTGAFAVVPLHPPWFGHHSPF